MGSDSGASVPALPVIGAAVGRPTVSAVRTDAPPRIDGQIDDAVWRSATRITNFVQQRPLEGAPATEETAVYVAYDSQHLYFAIHARYSDPKLIRANRVDRDQTGRDDTVTVFFDPFLDQQRGYSFSVNGYGVQGDALLSGGGGGGGGRGGGGPDGGGGGGGGRRGGGPGDSSWDALFHSAGTLVADGWTAEMAIPFKSLRYPQPREGQMHRWGFQIQRDISSKDESVVWAPTSRDVMGFLRQMGTLEGMTNLSMSRNLEILPTVTAIQSQRLGEGGSYGNSGIEEAGLSVKYGLTSNMTLDFTLNPDFSQIESDRPQIEVNQRFPLFFPELRPFFLEGQEVFSVPGPLNLVHTRTIVDPRYGAKLTGKLGKMTMGLVIADDEAPGNVEDREDPAFGQTAQFTLARLRYDVLTDSSVGVIFTDREFMDAYSRVGGVDGQFRIGRNQRFGFRAITSRHRDGAGVERAGDLIDFGYRKEGRNLSYSVNHFAISPGFRTDTGFVRRVDERRTGANVSYRWWPQHWIVNWGPRFDYSRNFTFGGTLQDEQLGAGANVQFARNIQLNVNLDRDMERYQSVNFDKTRFSIGGGVNSSRRLSVGGFINRGDEIRYVTNPFLGSGSGGGLFVTVRPFSRLQSDLNINTSRFVDVRSQAEVFDVKIYRSLTTYQFTDRLLVRSILEHNDYDRTLGTNFLVTYRVNAGTVFFAGYDDRYRQADRIVDQFFTGRDLRRTNRALFAKLQVLFRY